MRQAFAAMPGDIVPGVRVFAAHSVRQGQIGGEDMDMAGDMTPNDGHITNAPISIIRPEDGPTVVESLPVKAVPAQGKVHLFAVGRSCFPEMDK